MISRIVILFSIIAVARCGQMNLAFTQVSKTKFGESCLNDCVDGKCYTDDKFVEKNCVIYEETAPTYYTSQTQAKPTCLSRCGKYGYDYEWCYVSNDRSWDYCNSDISITWIYNQYKSLHYGPCADSCEFDGKTHMCTDFNKVRRECDQKQSDNFVQGRTNYGDKCLDRCKQHNGKRYNNYYCEYLNYKTMICAPPAKPPPMNDYYQKLSSSDCGSRRGKRCINYYSTVTETANKIEKSKYFTTEKVNEARNPVYSYTVKPAMTEGDPVLPLVVRAKITADTVKPQRRPNSRSKQDITKKDHNMENLPRDKTISMLPSDVTENLDRMAKLPKDKPRKLVGFYLGGLNKVFNVVPLRRSVRNTLQTFEEEIYNWLKRRNTVVDLTIVVMYNKYSRPDALAVDIVFWKGNNIVRTKRDNILKNIGEKQEGNIIQPEKRTNTVKPEVDDEEIDILQGLA